MKKMSAIERKNVAERVAADVSAALWELALQHRALRFRDRSRGVDAARIGQ